VPQKIPQAPGKKPRKVVRQPRPDQPSHQLSKQDIIEAAIQVAMVDGTDALTMRRVADHLGVSAMAPYYYVKGKHDLIFLLVDHAFSEVVIPEDDEGDWEARLRELTARVGAVTEKYGRALAVNLHMQVTPAGSRLLRAGRDMLRESGLPDDEVEPAHAFWHLYTLGRMVFNAGQWQGRPSARGRRPQSTRPTVLETGSHVYGSSAFQDFALDLFIHGVKTRVAQRASSSVRRRVAHRL
jgi:AcrR family transcriptional regulator